MRIIFRGQLLIGLPNNNLRRTFVLSVCIIQRMSSCLFIDLLIMCH